MSEQSGERWQVAVTNSTTGFQQASFVNSIWTLRGGTHVESVMRQMVDKILAGMRAWGWGWGQGRAGPGVCVYMCSH